MIERIQNISKSQIIKMIFWIIPSFLSILLGIYWKTVLEEHLLNEAQRNADNLAKSQKYILNEALLIDKKNGEPNQIIKEMNTILHYKERNTEISFIQAIELKVDEDILDSKFNIFSGTRKINENDYFITKISLLDKKTKELIGVVTFYSSIEFFNRLKKDMRMKLFILLLIIFGILIFLWYLLNLQLKKIQEQQAHLIHYGRLTSLGEMATGIAHELNQPLAIMRIKADGIKRFIVKNALDSKKIDSVQTIINQIERAAKIIRNMRFFASPGTNNFDLIDLSEPLSVATSFFNEQFRHHQIIFSISAEDVPRVRINPHKFELIIVNLLLNAKYAVDKKGETNSSYKKEISLRLFYRKENKSVILEVEDNGIGMDIEVKKRCMEPFYTTKNTGGMGLGLSIIFGIIQDHKMNIEIESVKDEGSIFRIIINNLEEKND